MTLKPFSDGISVSNDKQKPFDVPEPGKDVVEKPESENDLKPFSSQVEIKGNFFDRVGDIRDESLTPSFSEDPFGGPGSGHYDHGGRPGKVGGSQPGEGVEKKPYVSPTKKAASEMEEEYKKLVNKEGKGHLTGLGLEIKKVGEEWKPVKKAPDKVIQTGPKGWLKEKPDEIKAVYLKIMDGFNVSEREVHETMGFWKAGDDLTDKQEKMVKTAFPGVGDPEELPAFFPIHRTDTIAEPLKKDAEFDKRMKRIQAEARKLIGMD